MILARASVHTKQNCIPCLVLLTLLFHAAAMLALHGPAQHHPAHTPAKGTPETPFIASLYIPSSWHGMAWHCLCRACPNATSCLFGGAACSWNSTTQQREELNQPVFAAIDAFEYPELHDESIAARSFFAQLSKLLGVCGVKDFGMKVRQSGCTQLKERTHAA